jgi:hypothetical protein
VQAAPNRSDYDLLRAMIEAARVRLSARAISSRRGTRERDRRHRRVLEFNPANREALDRATELEKCARSPEPRARVRRSMKERARRQAEPPAQPGVEGAVA